ncbi:beta-galactosidase [Paenibacillus sp. PR3]|uniref:Beta-galactosidase n=1 Tax=Paenibacillus terricola TaxID=2763503 RepID=A0ABR8N503_9BACL|nr:beta-galactosidase [Paenibacillus terricola]MBD3922326.1 beta-galactosidase [Paenibacillus terricola]
MSRYRIDAREDQKAITAKPNYLEGTSPTGGRISFTNYYMEQNEQPFFGICGEFHYSRYNEKLWEDELIKMKMGGINIVCTYIFWNIHEEIEGEYDWSGRRNLRQFIELCAKHDLQVIIRIGPFCHGEIRNGGMPDWLYGQPYEVRSNDERYLVHVRRLYNQISEQVQGLLFKQGGPIIGTQIENEHGHSAAQWAMTTGISNQWMTTGLDGEAHMRLLKQIAVEAGIVTPLYTCTAWGGANAPADEMLPLWGGYSHWPWIYYEHDRFGEMREHPATPEYIFRDKHNNAIPKSYNFEPMYVPEDYPYACCEMGGGMTPFYRYRFDFPYISVPAMTGIKVAEGCNLIGYYMYHGGSNPTGKRELYLNDLATPKITYDFNACIGEFGQVRESYHRTRLQHYSYRTFEQWLCLTKTILPGDTSAMDPYDTETLRYAVRAADGSGLLFINNYQDHAVTHDLSVEDGVTVVTREKEIRFPLEGPLKLGKDSYAMLPYRFNLDGIMLEQATVQPITRLESEGVIYYFFSSPQGMPPEFVFASDTVTVVEAGAAQVVERDSVTVVYPTVGDLQPISLRSSSGQLVRIVTLTDAESLDFWKAELWGKERIVLTSSNLLVGNDQVKLEITGSDEIVLRVFPDFEELPHTLGGELVERTKQGLFTEYRFRIPTREVRFELERVADYRAIVSFPQDALDGMKEALLRINYKGDIGYAFVGNELVNDNFSNGNTWEIGLKHIGDRLTERGLNLYISPIRRGSSVNSNTTMAGWSENAAESNAQLDDISVESVYELVLNRG